MSSTGRRRSNIRQYSAEGEALNQISKEAEDRLAAKRAARTEAREIRQREMERKMKEQEMVEGNGESPPDATPKNYREEEPEDVPARDKDRDFKNEFRELEEKYKGAMMSLAQLDNERTALNYSVDLMKEELEEREESSFELQRQLKEKTRDLEFARRDFKDCEQQLAQLKDVLTYQEKVMEESGFMVVRDEEGKMVVEKTCTIHNGPISGSVLLTSETLGLLQKEEGTLGTATNRPTCSRATQTPSNLTQTEGTDVPDGGESPPAATPSHSAANDGTTSPENQADQSSDLTGISSQAAEEVESSVDVHVDGVAVEVSQGLHEEGTKDGIEAQCVVADEPDGSGGGTSSGEKTDEALPSAKEQMVLEVGLEGAINREDSGISSPDATTTANDGSAEGVLLSVSVECECDPNLTRNQSNPAGPGTGADLHSDEEEFYDACSSPLPTPLDGQKFSDTGSTRLTEDKLKLTQGPEVQEDPTVERLDQSSVDPEGTSVDGPEFLLTEESKVEEQPKSSPPEAVEPSRPAESQKKNKKKRNKKKKKQKPEGEKEAAGQEVDGAAAGEVSLKEEKVSDEKPAFDEGSAESEAGICDKTEDPEIKVPSDETTKTSSSPEAEKQNDDKAEVSAVAPAEPEKPLLQVDLTDTQSDQNEQAAELGNDTMEETVEESQETKAVSTVESLETEPDTTADGTKGEDDHEGDMVEDIERSEKVADASDTEKEQGGEAQHGDDDVQHDADTVSEDPEQMSPKGSHKRKQEGFDRTLSEGNLPQDKKLKFEEAGQSEEAMTRTETKEEQAHAEEAEAKTQDLPVKFEAGEVDQPDASGSVIDSSKAEESAEVPQTSEDKESNDTKSTDGITEVAEALISSPSEKKADVDTEALNQGETVDDQQDQESHDKEESKGNESEKHATEEKDDTKEDVDSSKTEEKLETSHVEFATNEDAHLEEKDEERSTVENQDNTASEEDGGHDKLGEEKLEHPDEDFNKPALKESPENTDENQLGDETEETEKQTQTQQTSTPLQKATSIDQSEEGGNDEYDFDDIDEVLEIPPEPGISESSDQQDKISQLSSPSLDTLDTLDTTSTHSGISTDRIDTGSMASLLSSSDDKQGDEAAATPSKTSEKSEHGKHSKKKSKAEKGEKADKSVKGTPLGSFRKSKKSKADDNSQTPGEQTEKGAGAGSGAEHPEKHDKDKKKGFFKNLFK